MFEKGSGGGVGGNGDEAEWLKSQKFKRQNSQQQAICKVIIILTYSRLNTEIFDLSDSGLSADVVFISVTKTGYPIARFSVRSRCDACQE